MKRWLQILSALALAGATAARADVLIYQFRNTSKNVGEGVEFSSSSHGYLVWNLEDNHLTWISYTERGGSRRYTVSDGEPLVVTVAGSSDRHYTTFSGASGVNGTYFQDFNRGLNKSLGHRTGQVTSFPRLFKGTSHSLVTSIGPRLSDNTHTHVYSPKRTIAANDAGQTEDVVVASLRAELEARGYVDVSFASGVGQIGSVSKAAAGAPQVISPVAVSPLPAGTAPK